jgi:hypothetical protein
MLQKAACFRKSGNIGLKSSFSFRIGQSFVTAVHLSTELYGIDRLLIIMETCVFCEVGTEYLKAV